MGIKYTDFIKKPNLELEYTPEMLVELQKCAEDIWNFLPYVKIVHPDRGVITFNPYDFQKHILKNLQKHRFHVILCGRQLGKTTVISIYALWFAIFNADKTIGIVSNKQSSAIDILKRLKKTYEELPVWLKPGIIEWSKTFVTFDNGTQIMVSATSEDAFRGRTLNILFCDEYAFVPKNIADAFWAANYPTISSSVDAKIIIISTPNGMFNQFHTIYSHAERGENEFIHLKFDWRANPERDEAWATSQRKNLGNKKFTQEHLVEFLGSTNTVISPDVMEYLFTQYESPIHTDMNGRFRIFEKPERGCRYVLGCLPPYEKVRTNNGIKDIIDVLPTDNLYDENGNETNIKNIQVYKDFEGDIYDIETYGSVRKTKFTSEHPIFVSHQPKKMKRMRNHPIYGTNRYRDFNFQYTKAKDVNINDWICFPNIYNKAISLDELDKKWEKYNNITRTDFRLIDNPLKDKDFWWFIGMWLGDGWIQNRNDRFSIHTCHNAKTESHFAEKVKSVMKKYGRCVYVNQKEMSSVIYTKFNSKQIHHFLQDTFGQYSQGKYISEWVKYIPTEYKQELIRGYIDSDGCILYKNDRCRVSIVSISLYLMEDIQDILYSLGYISSIGLLRNEGNHSICKRIYNTKKTYQLTLHNYDSVNLLNNLNYKDFDITKIRSMRNRNKRYCYFSDDKTQIYIRIKNIVKSQYIGDVYNFETESHTFLCHSLTTHNCDVAKGTGEHDSVCQVLKFISLDPIKFEQVAVFQNNFTDVYSFSDIINRISIYYNNAYIMVENNAEGAAVVNKLWWDIETENLVNTGAKAVNLGIRATKNTKPKAVLLMKKVIEDNCLKIRDKETVEQLASFIEQNGKFFGKDLGDDLISALYWAVYVTQMDVFDETISLKTGNDGESEEEIWGVLSDIHSEAEEDFKWLDNILS